jgi:hypothetical protein
MYYEEMYVEFNSIFKSCLIFCVLIQDSKNELGGDYTNVHEKKIAIVAINLMDGRTIPSIQDVATL